MRAANIHPTPWTDKRIRRGLDTPRQEQSNEDALDGIYITLDDRAAMMKSLIGLADGHRRRGECTAATARAAAALDVNDSVDPAEVGKDVRTVTVTAAVRLSCWYAEQGHLDEAGRWLTRIN
jgi:hypothetical protein